MVIKKSFWISKRLTTLYRTHKKRAAYDKYGEEAIKKDGGKRPEDIFGAMFGKDAKMGPKNTKSVIHPISCSLEDLYNGKKTKIKINRNRLVK